MYCFVQLRKGYQNSKSVSSNAVGVSAVLSGRVRIFLKVEGKLNYSSVIQGNKNTFSLMMKTGRASPKNALVRSCLTRRRAQQGVAVSRSHAQLPTQLSFLKRARDRRKSPKQFREVPPHP